MKLLNFKSYIPLKRSIENLYSFWKLLLPRTQIKAQDLRLAPPSEVKNMKILDRNAFTKVVCVPFIMIKHTNVSYTVIKLKSLVLKLPKFNYIKKPFEDSDLRQILLNPERIKCEKDVKSILGDDYNLILKYSLTEVTINYENWTPKQILKAVLADYENGSSSYSIVGHILQLNLREHLLPYKSLIAEVYIDKISRISMVVNKVDIIDNSDNTFRCFTMEKLAGDSDTTITTVKENDYKLTFDFAKVYWNSRLRIEHERIVNKISEGDILFDVMAGVGPFAIPAANKKCKVYANDLNPASYEALKNNCVINKVTEHVECYNMDGKDFIKTIIKEKLLELLSKKKEPIFKGSLHITMNLPSVAVNFLQYFKDLYNKDLTLNLDDISNLPIIHVYIFSYNETPEFALYLVACKLGYITEEIDITGHVKEISVNKLDKAVDSHFKKYVMEIINIRKVSPAKVMYRVSFRLPKEFFVNCCT